MVKGPEDKIVVTGRSSGIGQAIAIRLADESAVNPTLTIVANARRVSDHLADRLGGKEA